MPLPTGQQIAAFVPYTKRKQEWIIATVVKFNVDSSTYEVQDKFPENRKKIYYENVPEHKVEPFPCPDGTQFLKGAKVLALWMIDARADEWTTVFYKAHVVESGQKNTALKDQTITIIFPHDQETYQVDISKVVPRMVRLKTTAIKSEPEIKTDLKPTGPSGELKRSSGAVYVDPTAKRPKTENDSDSNSEQPVPIIVKRETEPYVKPPPTALDALFQVNFEFSTASLSAKKKILRNYARISACRCQTLPVE